MDDETSEPTRHEYGINAQPAFTDMIHLMNLPPDYLPQTGKHRKPNRLIIVGDVHGMKEALLDLLAKVDFNDQHDHLILAGDMISKGPDSPGVVDLAMKLGASGVRGNHEDRIILAHADMVAQHKEREMDAPGPNEDADKATDGLEEASFSHGDYKDRALVRELGEDRIKWLKKCPVILRVGRLEGMAEVVVVHAGLTPGVDLKNQDPSMVMNMRTLVDGIPSEERDGQHWDKVRFFFSFLPFLSFPFFLHPSRAQSSHRATARLTPRRRSGTNTRGNSQRRTAPPSSMATTQNAVSN